MILKSETESLLNRMTEGTKHRKEVKATRTFHTCSAKDNCKNIDSHGNKNLNILIGEPAIIITNEITVNERIIFTKPKYYHKYCDPT